MEATCHISLIKCLETLCGPGMETRMLQTFEALYRYRLKRGPRLRYTRLLAPSCPRGEFTQPRVQILADPCKVGIFPPNRMHLKHAVLYSSPPLERRPSPSSKKMDFKLSRMTSYNSYASLFVGVFLPSLRINWTVSHHAIHPGIGLDDGSNNSLPPILFQVRTNGSDRI